MMKDRPDYYVVLGVEPTATSEAIRLAYRARAQVLHPDRFDRMSSPTVWAQANAMLRELNGAFAVLSVPSRRVAYDLSLFNRKECFSGYFLESACAPRCVAPACSSAEAVLLKHTA